jgi:ankyrin repeat protein
MLENKFIEINKVD